MPSGRLQTHLWPTPNTKCILVVGFAPGGKKLSDAVRLGVEVIPYADFLTKLGTPIK